MIRTLPLLCALTLSGGCALSRGADPVESTPPAPPPDAQPAEPGKNGEPAAQPQFPPVRQPGPWSLYTTAANGVGSNVHFDQENIGSYGAVLALGARYDGKDFAARYEAAGHSYTNSNRWDRVSHFMSMSYEFGLPGNWDLETIGQLAFKGSSEDRDIVDQDIEISPRLEYRLTPEKRLRFFTVHRYKRYKDAPLTNALKNYVGLEYRHLFAPRYFVEVGGRFETNDERLNRGDYRRWSYWVEHGVPLGTRDALLMQVRYRLKRYSNRFVEVEDEDVLRVDHRWVPSISWMHTFATNVDLRLDYLFETNYSNNFEREYGAHLLWFTIGYRWQK